MSSLSWNQTYRASDFNSYIGNQVVKSQLKTLVERDKLPQTLMFVGNAGTGKTSLARILTKMLLCPSRVNGLACGECAVCNILDEEYIQSGKAVQGVPVYDYNITNMNTIDDANRIIEQMRSGASLGYKRVFILDEIQEASKRAQNAFLKVTEEPMENTFIIMCTTHPQNIVPAIKSRFHIFNIKKPSTSELVDHLAGICQAEGVDYTKSALKLLVNKLGRVPRDCVNRCETLGSLGKVDRITVEESLGVVDFTLYVNFINGYRKGLLADTKGILDELLDRGISVRSFLLGFGEFLASVINLKYSVSVEDYASEELSLIKRVAKGLPDTELLKILGLISKYTLSLAELDVVHYYAFVGELQDDRPAPTITETSAVKSYRSHTESIKKREYEPSEPSMKDIRSLFNSNVIKE